MSCLLAKIDNPTVDIRRPYTEIEGEDTYSGRFYDERYVLAAFVLANPEKYKPIFPGIFISEDKELSNIISPIWEHPNTKYVEKHGSSFWILIN